MGEPIDFSKLYESFFKQCLEGILVLDRKYSIRFSNPGAERILGYQEGQLNEKKLDSIITEGFQQRCLEMLGQFFDPEQKLFNVKTTATLLKKEGTNLVVEISIGRYLDLDHGPLLIIMFSDITERCKAEENLREERELYVNVLEKMGDSFISFDHQWHFTYINDKAFKLFGRKEMKANFIDKVLWEVFPEIKGTIFETEYRKVMEKREISTFESDIVQKELWFEISAFPHDGGIGVFLRDVTEKRNIQISLRDSHEVLEKKVRERTIELTQALELQKESNDLKSRFVSTASHEFRTPLACLLTSVSILEKYIGPENHENTSKHLNRIKSSVNVLTDILDDFLSLDKLEHDKVRTVGNSFDLKETLKSIIEKMNGMLKPGQSINCIFNGDTHVFQDKKIIYNSLLNLLSNAIKYSDENQCIDIHTIINDGYVTCSIKDEGLGIPKPEQKNIFSIFFRAKNVETIQGTGLGLAIVKKYMELIGGTISFSSVENEGSTFTIRFPRTVKEK